VFPNFTVDFFDETVNASNFLDGANKWLCFIIELSWTIETLDKTGFADVDANDNRAVANTKSLVKRPILYYILFLLTVIALKIELHRIIFDLQKV
jgi:hypothetical protein